jgi:Lrp/AsnC family leucine-responsive transcriptional regulator
MHDLDRLDLRILALLQESSALTNQELSDRLHLSASQCSRRRERLRELGIIQREAVIIDAAAMGLTIKAFILVTLSKQAGRAREFHELMRVSPEVIECSVISGMANFIVEIQARNMEGLRALVIKIVDTRLVRNARVSIVVNELKNTTALPLPAHLAITPTPVP